MDASLETIEENVAAPSGSASHPSINKIRDIDIVELTNRGIDYIKAGKKKGLLELETLTRHEPLDAFKVALELLSDGRDLDYVQKYLATNKEQTIEHLNTIFSLLDIMVSSIKNGDDPTLVEKFARLYFKGKGAS